MIKMEGFSRKDDDYSNESGLGDSGVGASEPECVDNSSALGPVAVHVYNENRDTAIEMFVESDKCEDICLSLVKKLGITPAVLGCFGLGVLDTSVNKFYWLAPSQKPSEVCNSLSRAKDDVHFRMRVLPKQTKCSQLYQVDPKCLEYLTWQVKWDFLHNYMQCFIKEPKNENARGISCMLILLKLRMNTERKNCQENVEAFLKGQDLNQFLPEYLKRKLLEKRILEDSMMKKVKKLQKKYPATDKNTHDLMTWCLAIILEQNYFYYSETFDAYDLSIDSEEYERIEEDDQPLHIMDRKKLSVSVKMEQSYPKLMVARKDIRNDNMINCYVENISKLEIRSTELGSETWWRIQLFRQDGHPKMIYFKERKEAYSFATCLECYSRLIYYFYESICHELEPSHVRELNGIRAHGPVSDEFAKNKLLKTSKDLYILRANLAIHGQFDVLYLPSTTSRLQIMTLPKIIKVEEGYMVEGEVSAPPRGLKFVINDLIRNTNFFPEKCQRIKPQSEGCNVLQSLLMDQEPRDLQDNDEERREKKRIENQPKVYSRPDLVIQSLLGVFHRNSCGLNLNQCF